MCAFVFKSTFFAKVTKCAVKKGCAMHVWQMHLDEGQLFRRAQLPLETITGCQICKRTRYSFEKSRDEHLKKSSHL